MVSQTAKTDGPRHTSIPCSCSEEEVDQTGQVDAHDRQEHVRYEAGIVAVPFLRVFWGNSDIESVTEAENVGFKPPRLLRTKCLRVIVTVISQIEL